MIQSGTVSTSGDDILSVPVGERYAAVLVTICNNGTATRTFDLHAVKSGDSPSATNRVLINREVKGYDSFFISEKFLLEAGDSLRAVASSNGALTATVSWADL
jgi:hypothetical protein